MLLLLSVAVSCFFWGSSETSRLYEKMCYGNDFRIPELNRLPYFKGQLYITPSSGGKKMLLMDDGKAVHPRIKIRSDSVYLTDLRETDDGQFSLSFEGRENTATRLKIVDCSEKVRRYYGNGYNCDIPSGAEFLEFKAEDKFNTKVLWNRSHPEAHRGGRGWVKGRTWKISHVTQSDSGYYNFRSKSNALLSRVKLTVEETHKYLDVKVNEQLYIDNPEGAGPWTVTFIREGEDEDEAIPLIMGGTLGDEDLDARISGFKARLWIVDYSIEINPVLKSDSGKFEFRDADGNLAQTVHVNVIEAILSLWYIGLGVFFAVIGCCLVRKCCCKKSSAPQTAAATAVYIHNQNPPVGSSDAAAPPAYYSYRPVNPVVTGKPAATSGGQSVWNPVNIHVNPYQPEVGAPGEQGPPATGFLSSDPEPQFELKGLSFPSAPPLSSESTVPDVYTSDKLNFL